MTSEYELQRQRNIEDNNRALVALGLDQPLLKPLPIANVAPRTGTYVRRVWFRSEERVASLRGPDPVSAKPKKGRARLMSLRSHSHVQHKVLDATIDKVQKAKPRPRKFSDGTGQRGGWNAGPYVGTALVHGSGGRGRYMIAIRKRPDGRFYGYVGRTQLSFRAGTLDNLPCVLSGFTVVKYQSGGSL